MRSDRAPDGGGSGGGPLPGTQIVNTDGEYLIEGNQVTLVAQPSDPPAIPGRSIVTILAAGLGVDGLVDVRGSQGVRVTAGPPPALPAASSTTNGVDVIAGQTGSIKLERGLLPVDQKIEMTPAGIKINAGSMPVTIESLTGITLSVAGGVAKIKIGPEGVTIEGLTLRLSGQILTEIKGTMTTVQSTAITKVSGALTMLG
jgi:hypothetical protein